MEEHKPKDVTVHLRIGEVEAQIMDDLAEYYKELGQIKTNSRGEIIRYALNKLHQGTKKMIEEHRFSEG